VNLNYEDKWVENSRVLSLYEKKNYARNVSSVYLDFLIRIFANTG